MRKSEPIARPRAREIDPQLEVLGGARLMGPVRVDITRPDGGVIGVRVPRYRPFRRVRDWFSEPGRYVFRIRRGGVAHDLELKVRGDELVLQLVVERSGIVVSAAREAPPGLTLARRLPVDHPAPRTRQPYVLRNHSGLRYRGYESRYGWHGVTFDPRDERRWFPEGPCLQGLRTADLEPGDEVLAGGGELSPYPPGYRFVVTLEDPDEPADAALRTYWVVSYEW